MRLKLKRRCALVAERDWKERASWLLAKLLLEVSI
jgi:hypothetical protein